MTRVSKPVRCSISRPSASPTPRDRVLATRYGLRAADLALAGEFGQMAALRGDDVVAVPLAEATAELKVVPREWYEVARAFFG